MVQGAAFDDMQVRVHGCCHMVGQFASFMVWYVRSKSVQR